MADINVGFYALKAFFYAGEASTCLMYFDKKLHHKACLKMIIPEISQVIIHQKGEILCQKKSRKQYIIVKIMYLDIHWGKI